MRKEDGEKNKEIHKRFIKKNKETNKKYEKGEFRRRKIFSLKIREKNKGEEIRIKLERIERKMEWQKREERRKNKIIKGLEVKSGKRKKAVKKVRNKIEVKANIREM